jgi:hypothetical protein
VIALDDAQVVDQPLELRVRFLVLDSGRAPSFLGREVYFKASSGNEGTQRSDNEGLACLSCTPSKVDISFVVQAVSEDGKRAIQDQATVFHWPADAKVLLLDVESTLFAAPQDGALRPDASATLLRLQEHGFRIAYLALAHQELAEFKLLRGQVRHHQLARTLPPGPVYVAANFADADGGRSRRQAATALAERFPKPLLVLAGSAELASQYRAVPGLAVILLSETETVAGLPKCASWNDVGKELLP